MTAEAAAAPALEARLGVTVGTGKGLFTVESELALARGVLVLFGPSGAGKSLTLQALAGLVKPAHGRIVVGGRTLYDSDRRIDVPAHRRGIGYVPQHQSLFPFHTVYQNVVFGLPRAQRKAGRPEILALLDELGIRPLCDSGVARLSGGERQRVALARALAVRPQLLVLDEPFAALDQDGRTSLRQVLRKALDAHGTPAVFVTHDPDEALALGDSVVRFERGRTTTAGAPHTMLRRGHPVSLQGQAVGEATATGDGRAEIVVQSVRIEAPAELLHPDQDGMLRLDLRTRPRDPSK